jgi:rhamnosyl/mannosyltransferase
LYDGTDATALVNAWEALLADPERARELGRQGRASVEREYTIERLAERYLELTRDSMAEPARVG